MWRATALYFTPGEAGATKGATTGATSYSDAGRIGNPATNYYYLILATANNCPLGVSHPGWRQCAGRGRWRSPGRHDSGDGSLRRRGLHE